MLLLTTAPDYIGSIWRAHTESAMILFIVLCALVSPAFSQATNDGDKIIGGVELAPNAIPYIVSLQYSDDDFHFCGGSIYDHETVITAAHCCDGKNPSEFRAVAGEHDLRVPEATEQRRDLSQIIIHNDYNSRDLENDICLLKLQERFDFGSDVHPVDMPTYLAEPQSDRAYVSGWGTTTMTGPGSDVLMGVDIPIVSDIECRIAYAEDSLEVYDSNICAGEFNHDHCYGDSGGPVTCDNDGIRGPICGIVSWAIGCALPGYPGVNTQVSYFTDWIAINAA